MALQRTATKYDRWARLNRGGFNNVNSVPPNGLGDVVSDTLGFVNTVQTKLDNLDTAIKTLLVLSGVAALTGVVTVFRR